MMTHFLYVFVNFFLLFLNEKEKVEEDRFIRELDHQNYLARKMEEDEKVAMAEMSAAEEVAKARMDAAVGEVFGILSQTGEKLSDAAVENFAAWKLGK